MIVNDDQVRICKEEDVAYLKALLQDTSGETKENIKKIQTKYPVTKPRFELRTYVVAWEV
jgi:hypothetical protein